MNLKKKIKNFFSPTLILVMFSLLFIVNSNNKAKADLVLCVNTDIKEYVVIDDQYQCPNGYSLQNGDFNLNGYTRNDTYDPTTDPNNTSTSTNKSGSNNNSTSTNNGTGTGTGNGNGTGTGTGNLGASNFNDPSSYLGLSSNPNSTIEDDPSLASGPFLSLDPTDYPYCVLLTHDLFYKSKDVTTDGEISALQSYLTDRGFLETGATGYYGRATEWGVKRFQYLNQISVTGVVTSDMRDILKELTCVKFPKVTYVDKPLSTAEYMASIKAKTISSKTLKTKPKTTKKVKTPTKKVTVIPTTKSTTILDSAPVNIPSKDKNKVTIITPSNNNTNNANNNTNTNNSNYVSITPTTNNKSVMPVNPGPILNNSKLSSLGGTISFTKANNLYFTFTTNSSTASLCTNYDGTDCSLNSNYYALSEGVKGSLYEATNITGKWAITIYGNKSWGSAGNKVNIFLKDSQNSNTVSVYTIVLSN